MKTRIKTCLKCGSSKKSHHHIRPKVFWGRKGIIAILCPRCHRELEIIILSEEPQRNGRRVKMPEQYYVDCLLEFITQDTS